MTHILRSFLAAVLVATALATPAVARQTAQNDETSLAGNYLAARTAGRIHDNAPAIAFLTAALKQDPANAVMTERLFQLQLAEGNLPEAEALAERVISSNSQHRMARIVLGLKEFRAKNYEQARNNFAEAAYTPIGELTSVLLTAWTYAGEGSHIAAMKELDKLDRNESFANFKAFHVALISDYLNNVVRAEAAYKRAYQDTGTSLRVTQAYGNYLERNRRFAEAEKVYRTFLEGGDRNVLVQAALERLTASKTTPPPFVPNPEAGASEALFSLAAAMNDDQSIDVALLYGQLALSFTSDKPVVLTLLGDILAGSQRYQAAIDTFEQVPPSSELHTNADLEVAVNMQRLDRTADAEARMRAIVAREPKNLDGWATLGNIMRNSENYEKAAQAYDAAIALVPQPTRENWTLFYYRGISFERLKQWDKAEADFRKALSLSPDEASVLNYLGYSLIDANRKLDEAIAMVRKAVEIRPNDGYIVDSLGWAYFTLGNFDLAVEHLERAVDLKPADPIIAEHLGDAYWRVGRTLEARFQWQHAKDNRPEPADLARIEDKLKNGMPPLTEPPKPADNSGTSNSNG